MSLSDITNIRIHKDRRSEILDRNEPLLISNEKRFVLFPIQYNDIYAAYQVISSKFYIPQQFGTETYSLNSLPIGEREIIERILLYWSYYNEQSLIFKMNNDIQIPEARCFFGFQINSQINHRELFSILLRSVNYKHDLMDNKIELLTNLLENESFGGRLITYSAMESICISSLYILKMLLLKSDELKYLIIRIDAVLNDKSEYTKFGAILFRHCINKPNESKFHSIIKQIVEAEIEFLVNIIGSSICSFNQSPLSEFVQFEADKICDLFKFQRIYKGENPFK
uniref:Ribonucleoside diphosphate reductase subunit M2 n=1 Tax=Schmidtea mediterranea TaxID=79327 RepID=I1ZIH2_SCHMD|nr:ribonucleoside diphosphate reductase subunit M2 [Schmidtea mediterranea]